MDNCKWIGFILHTTKTHLIPSQIMLTNIYFTQNIYENEYVTINASWRQYRYQDRWWWTLFYFSLFILFYFSFLFLFLFLFLEQLGLGFISHTVTSVTNWWWSHKTDHGTWENGVEGSGTKWCHTAWTTHAGLMLYSWSFRIGCTVASMDHGE